MAEQPCLTTDDAADTISSQADGDRHSHGGGTFRLGSPPGAAEGAILDRGTIPRLAR
ncbi:hypothetical protein V1290_004696 [Bradyrhizobium sp. AZCC 1578]